ncbi:MAG: YHS domain-containing protein [Geobacter sp.]|nr:YHS domain-containing protein [Geobacter sp.]
MADAKPLSDRITSRLERHQLELGERQSSIDFSMKALLDQQERFASVAQQIIGSVIRPRMEELARHFENAELKVLQGNSGFHCVCDFAHTPRFPATVSFDICLLPGESKDIKVRSDIQIYPILMEYKRDDTMSFPLDGPEEAIGPWVEERIVEFLDTYLRLETHPYYQKDNIVTDPVCGMQISAIAATSKIECGSHTVYFCSDACKEAFSKNGEGGKLA